jgi:hypothetical protein
MIDVPAMAVGPYGGWQSRLPIKNTCTFASMLDVPAQLEFVRANAGVARTMAGLPFSTEFIGLRKANSGEIVCIDGHHRAAAIALAARDGASVDFSKTEILIALADLRENEVSLLDAMLKRGTSKIPPPNE